MGKITYIKNAAQIVTVSGSNAQPKKGKSMSELHVIHQGGIVIEDDRIVFVGSDAEAQDYVDGLVGTPDIIDATGKTVTPGLVDPHTHLVFAGSREQELEMRLNGATYIEILQNGGGILYSTTQTRAATEEQLFAESKKRLDSFLKHGVTTLEAKSFVLRGH
jgi:imidazolonepropionase